MARLNLALLALFERTISEYRGTARLLRSTGAVVAWANAAPAKLVVLLWQVEQSRPLVAT